MSLDLLSIVAALLALVLALTLHEFAHALMGTYLGDDTAKAQGRLSLNPVAHIDPLMTLALPLLLILTGSPVVFGAAKPVPFNPWAVRGGRWGAAAVAAAGPLTNLFLAVFFALWLHIVSPGPGVYEFLATMIAVNLGLFVFNMIPFPPLDGSRLLYAVAPAGLRQVMDRIEQMGMAAVLVFVFVGYYLGLGYFVTMAVRFFLNLLLPAGSLP